NGEDDHRCLRCGRRLTGTVIAAPPSYIGATALAMAVSPAPESARDTAPVQAKAPEQTPLFDPIVLGAHQAISQKVIPFEQIQRQAAVRQSALQPTAAARAPEQKLPPVPQRPSVKKASATPGGQGNLDFQPNSAQGERVLATGVP